MKNTLARLQTALAIANTNGDTASAAAIQTVIPTVTLLVKDPYIMPDVLTPLVPAVPPVSIDPAAVPATIAEAHDAVQAGTITRQDAVDAGVIQHVDQLPPSPAEVAAGVENVAPPTPVTPTPVTPAVAPQSDPGDETQNKVTPSPDVAVAVAAPVADIAQPATVIDTPAPTASADPVPAPSAPPATVDAAPAQVTPSVAATPDPVSAPAADPQPSVAPVAPISDADRLKALEDRVTADEAKEQAFEDEVKSGKVSRQ